LRGTRSRDVRAASLEERFDTTRGGVTVNNSFLPGAPTQSGASYSGGNPNLAPEKADTWTAGIVFTPTFLQGFSASLDWYKITINDAIDQPTAQQVVDAASRGDPQYTPLVVLDANKNIIEVDRFFINFAQQFVEGVDFEGAYRHSVHLVGGAEDITVRLYATDLIKNATVTHFGSYDEWAGQVGTARSLPKHKYNLNVTYSNGPASLFLQGRYISDGILDHTLIQSNVGIIGANGKPVSNTINNNHVGGIFYMDMNLQYAVPVPTGDLSVYGEVQNLFDRAPPATPAAFGRTGALSTNPQLYDILGRRYQIGVRYRF
jgi:outer membrane receptor protein involved in Fe transport